MIERPILFSAPMVRAILEGRKTQTRRICKGQRELSNVHDFQLSRCPYGTPGDRLWVRETWRDWSESAWHYAADGTVIPKQRDRDLAAFLAQRAPFTWESYSWRPSIHMPRAASRITLEITEVRVERLNDIGEADAQAEGVEVTSFFDEAERMEPATGVMPGRYAFRALWESIHGADSWSANPWVWVVGFSRVAP